MWNPSLLLISNRFYRTQNNFGPLTHCGLVTSYLRQGSRSTLAQVMACCLTAPSHYLNQCWLIISKVQWHSSEDNFTKDASGTITEISLKNSLSKISFKSPRGQWVKRSHHYGIFMGCHHGIGRTQYWYRAVTCNITVAIVKTIEIVAYLLYQIRQN